MKGFLKFVGILAGIAILAVIIIAALLPWMDRWGATDDEIAASFAGDELVPNPAHFLHPSHFHQRLTRRDLSVDRPTRRGQGWHVQLHMV